jgi:hypothetical protein
MKGRVSRLALGSVYGEVVHVGLYDHSRTGRAGDGVHPPGKTMLTDAKLNALPVDAATRTTFVDFNISVIDHEFDEGVFPAA